jgi:hypothetical protein
MWWLLHGLSDVPPDPESCFFSDLHGLCLLCRELNVLAGLTTILLVDPLISSFISSLSLSLSVSRSVSLSLALCLSPPLDLLSSFLYLFLVSRPTTLSTMSSCSRNGENSTPRVSSRVVHEATSPTSLPLSPPLPFHSRIQCSQLPHLLKRNSKRICILLFLLQLTKRTLSPLSLEKMVTMRRRLSNSTMSLSPCQSSWLSPRTL